MNAPSTARSLLETGLTFHREGRLEDALAHYRQVLSLMPEQPDALHYLGLIAHQTGNSATALRYLELAARHAPKNAELWSNFGAVNLALKRLNEAEACFLRFVELAPDHPGAHYALGTTLVDQFRAQEAELHLRKALALQPALAAGHGNLGHALQLQGRLTEAEAVLRHAVALDPALQPAWRTLAVTLEQQGRLSEAYPAYRKALSLHPRDTQTHSALLLALHFSGSVSKKELYDEALRFGQHFSSIAPLALPFTRTPGKLRIGYLCADLHDHPVSYFLENVVAAHDKNSFEFYAYSAGAVQDAVTERLKSHLPHWHDVSALSDEAAARLIAQDELDLLVELGGHTGRNRLGIMAHRPARKQASWLGYFDTTGLTQMDALIADTKVVPQADEPYYTETLFRLPHYFLCFTPPRDTVDVTALPALKNRYVTFGSFSKLAKLDAPAIQAWAEILRTVPESKLYLKTKALNDQGTATLLLETFAREGIGRERLILEGPSSLRDMYIAYGAMDIALDPFPHNGGTTSFQALYSGVPVLSLEGDRYVARMGEGILSTLGMQEWVAADVQDYVRKAVAFAADTGKLAALRERLRARLLASPLCDAKGFTLALEQGYREIIG